MTTPRAANPRNGNTTALPLGAPVWIEVEERGQPTRLVPCRVTKVGRTHWTVSGARGLELRVHIAPENGAWDTDGRRRVRPRNGVGSSTLVLLTREAAEAYRLRQAMQRPCIEALAATTSGRALSADAWRALAAALGLDVPALEPLPEPAPMVAGDR